MQNIFSNKKHCFANKFNIITNSSAVNISICFILTAFLFLGISIYCNTMISGLCLNNESTNTITDNYNISFNNTNSSINLPARLTEKTKSVTLTRFIHADELAANYISFYAYNSAVNIYIDNEQVYTENDIIDFAGFARPSHWYFVKVPQHDFTLTIDMNSQIDITNLLHISTGTKSALIFDILCRHAFQLVVGFLACICGIMLLITAFIIKTDLSKRLYWFGLTSMLAGIWTICNSTVIQLFFSHGTFTSYIGYCCYFLFPIAVTGFLLTFDHIKNEAYMYIAYWCEILSITVIFTMQLMGLIIVSNVLWIVHIEILSITLAVIITYIKNWKTNTIREFNIFISFMIISFFLILDIIRYYSNNSTFERIRFSVYGIALLLLYFSFSIFHVIKENFIQNTRNKIYKELAFTDAMTHINNRSAFELAMEKERLSVESHRYILIADLNNLKHINDTYGHRFGDEAIKNTARLMHENFMEIGQCYRIGGDEFCVIINNTSLDIINRCLKTFHQAVNDIAATTDYPYSVATGYGAIDESGIDNCFKAVDSIMYKNKIKSKKSRDNQTLSDG